MKVALASPPVATSVDHGLACVRQSMEDAARQGARIVCFPEAYLPGLRGQDFAVPAWTAADEAHCLATIAGWARALGLVTIAGIEHVSPRGSQIAAVVIGADGAILGTQTKNQLDPSEDAAYVPGGGRQVFRVDDLTFGIAICHEGWRYPETVRWAAMRGAQVVFHPQITGTTRGGVRLTEWGAATNPYYEQAMRMRSRENTIYFASVNYAVPFQESATSIIDPSGECAARLPYSTVGVLVHDLDLARATGLLARRFDAARHVDTGGQSPR